jgi:hypothetical protein
MLAKRKMNKTAFKPQSQYWETGMKLISVGCMAIYILLLYIPSPIHAKNIDLSALRSISWPEIDSMLSKRSFVSKEELFQLLHQLYSEQQDMIRLDKPVIQPGKCPRQGFDDGGLDRYLSSRDLPVKSLRCEDHFSAPHAPDEHRDMNLQVAIVGNGDGRLSFHQFSLRSSTSQARPANSAISVVSPLVLSSMSIPVSRISTLSTSKRISRFRLHGKQLPQKGLHVLERLGDILLGNIQTLISLASRGNMGQLLLSADSFVDSTGFFP